MQDAVALEEGVRVASDPKPEQRTRRANVYGLIACQGDSLTYGSRDPDGMSYPLYLGRTLSQKHDQTWTAVNLGVPGDASAAGLRRHGGSLSAADPVR